MLFPLILSIILMEIIIRRVNHQGHRCNDTNNPKDPDDPEVKDLDYNEYISRTWLHRYADLINYPYIATYNLNEAEVGYIKDAIPVGYVTGRPYSLLEEELDAITMRMSEIIPPAPTTGWFIRMSSASPKDGMRRGALWSAKEIVEQLSTSKRILIALHKGDRLLYLVPYDPEWEDCRELRVFIRKGRVTAISQYVWHKFALFSAMTDDELISVTRGVVDYLHPALPPILEAVGTQDVVCDLYWNPDETFKIIEFNSFGYWAAAGAALFHWQDDRRILYGHEPNKVYFRVHKMDKLNNDINEESI